MRIQALTGVSPDRQKVMGLLKGTSKMSSAQDALRFGKLDLRDGVIKFKMVGTPVAETATETARDIDVCPSSSQGLPVADDSAGHTGYSLSSHDLGYASWVSR
jgi:hypothetical protein